MTYQKLFDPQPELQDFRTEEDLQQGELLGDRRDGRVYLYTDKIILAINVAIATGRPLLMRGVSGSGKSSLAYNVARVMNRYYYEFTVTSRTQAQDLMWRFDAIRRLGDAQASKESNFNWGIYHPYIEPSVLWWVFDRDSARWRGYESQGEESAPFLPAIDPGKNAHIEGHEGWYPSVLLIDEIDKADPDVPNNLLVALGSLEFFVTEIQHKVQYQAPLGSQRDILNQPLVIVTTNDERRLPNAFLRRCVALQLENPSTKKLIEIAKAVEGVEHEALYNIIAQLISHHHITQKGQDGSISVAEFLDAVRACLHLGIRNELS